VRFLGGLRGSILSVGSGGASVLETVDRLGTFDDGAVLGRGALSLRSRGTTGGGAAVGSNRSMCGCAFWYLWRMFSPFPETGYVPERQSMVSSDGQKSFQVGSKGVGGEQYRELEEALAVSSRRPGPSRLTET
jgi:hypothetical protein